MGDNCSDIDAASPQRQDYPVALALLEAALDREDILSRPKELSPGARYRLADEKHIALKRETAQAKRPWDAP